MGYSIRIEVNASLSCSLNLLMFSRPSKHKLFDPQVADEEPSFFVVRKLTGVLHLQASALACTRHIASDKYIYIYFIILAIRGRT